MQVKLNFTISFRYIEPVILDCHIPRLYQLQLQEDQETNKGIKIILPSVRLYRRKLQENLQINTTIEANITMYRCSTNES